MRLFYPNLTRPKKASKCLAELLSLPLAHAQNAISKVCGYQNWFDLAHNCITQPPTKLDQALSEIDYVRRHAELSLALAAALNIPDGDAQFALARSRLIGDRGAVCPTKYVSGLSAFDVPRFLQCQSARAVQSGF